jgi:Rad3-related DNA helicase
MKTLDEIRIDGFQGWDWYNIQAPRTSNQAMGRIIRHRFDFGAIVLIDERYKKEENRVAISNWIKNSFSFKQQPNGRNSVATSVEDCLTKLDNFFSDMKTKGYAEKAK